LRQEIVQLSISSIPKYGEAQEDHSVENSRKYALVTDALTDSVCSELDCSWVAQYLETLCQEVVEKGRIAEIETDDADQENVSQLVFSRGHSVVREFQEEVEIESQMEVAGIATGDSSEATGPCSLKYQEVAEKGIQMTVFDCWRL
jgi:hypothetical protein